VPDINASNAQVRAAAERMAISTPVQGTAADIIKLAMIRIHAEMAGKGLKAKMILQVHDELLFDVPQNEADIVKQLALDIMSSALEFSVPLTVDVKAGKNWDEMS
jgi:DNA polymerase-1